MNHQAPCDETLQAKNARLAPGLNRLTTPEPSSDVGEAQFLSLIEFWKQFDSSFDNPVYQAVDQAVDQLVEVDRQEVEDIEKAIPIILDGHSSQEFGETSLTLTSFQRSMSSPQLHDNYGGLDRTASRSTEATWVRTDSAGPAAGPECTNDTVPSSLGGVHTPLTLPLENPNPSPDFDETFLNSRAVTRSRSSPQVHDNYGGLDRTASRSTEATWVRTDSARPAAGPECTNDTVPSSSVAVERLSPLSLENSNTLKRKATDNAEIRSRPTQPLLDSPLTDSFGRVLLAAVRFKKIESMQTDSTEPNWTNTSFPFIGGWGSLESYKLKGRVSLVQEVEQKTQLVFNGAGFKVGTAFFSLEMDGIFGLLRSITTPQDWLDLYRSQDRILLARGGLSMTNDVDRRKIEEIEDQLFNVKKYDGVCNFMTIITYGDSSHGSIALFEIAVQPTLGTAISLDLRGVLKQVPKPILKSLHLGHAIRLFSKDKCMKFGTAKHQILPCFMEITTNGKTWKAGDGWRGALGIGHNPSTQFDGLVATIPQMMALMHLKSSSLVDWLSTPPFDITPNAQGPRQSSFDSRVSRAVKLRSKPRGDGQTGSEVKVKVFYPDGSPWAREKILWA